MGFQRNMFSPLPRLSCKTGMKISGLAMSSLSAGTHFSLVWMNTWWNKNTCIIIYRVHRFSPFFYMHCSLLQGAICLDKLKSHPLLRDKPSKLVQQVMKMMKKHLSVTDHTKICHPQHQQQAFSCNSNITLNIWDFAGQSVYYTTHQVRFLSPKFVLNGHISHFTRWQIRPFKCLITQLEFSLTWSCVSLTGSTTTSEWKLFSGGQRFSNLVDWCHVLSLICSKDGMCLKAGI